MATINIKLNKNFTTQLNKLREKYGEEFEYLNGIGEKQLSFTDFIQNFIDKQNAADGSVDANANVSSKAMPTLLREMAKPHQILLCLNKIYYEMQKKYGFKTANEWLELNFTRALYMHDMPSASMTHYCYHPSETLMIVYKGQRRLVTFKELYDILDEKEEYDPSTGEVAKFPKDLMVEDADASGSEIEYFYTPVSRVVRHSNTKKMRFIKYANGISQIVTEDHPIITADGDKAAKDVGEEDMVLTVRPSRYSSSIPFISVTKEEYYKPHSSGDAIGVGEFPLNKDTGYLVGMFLAEGTVTTSTLNITQSKKSPYTEKIIYILNKYAFPYSIREDGDMNSVCILSCPFTKWADKNFGGQTAANKRLPSNFIHYNTEFLKGIVAGLIDGDGSIDGYKNRHCQIRIASRELLNQISHFLQFNGIFVGDRTPHRYKNPKSFEQKLPLFGIGFTLTNQDFFGEIGSLKIEEKYIPLERQGNFKNKKYIYDYGFVPVIENTEYIDDCPIVYDITTATGHFICNNVLSHNCFAYDLKQVAEKGLHFLARHNAEPPKHLDTFIQFVAEHTCWAANLSSGACGYPNLIPYMYYFWKKDIENGYCVDKIRYANQCIQSLIYRWNQPICRDSSQSAFTNVTLFDHSYLDALFGGQEFPDGSFMIDELEGIMEFQKMFLLKATEIRGENVMTFPVLTISCLYKDGKFEDEEFARWALETDRKWMLCNWFGDSDVTSLSNCCRLKSDIKDLYFNSIGGTALKVGSCKVSTINLARIAYETNNKKDFLIRLRDVARINLQALDVQRHIIQRNVEKGLLPNFTTGEVDFEHLYSTTGVLSPYETLKHFNLIKKDELGNVYYTEEADAFVKQIFEVLHNVMNDFQLDKDYKCNLEAIPGESAAVKFQRADALLYPDQVVDDLPLYGNQYLPLGIKATFAERVRVASLYDSYCNGG